MNSIIPELEKKLNYQFENKSLLKEALTHRSYAAEKELDYNNQRLEFLGDAVLEIIVTERLYFLYPKALEGDLTKMRSALAQQEALATMASELELSEYIYMGKGELEAGGNKRQSTLSDTFEALLGAIFLDSGMENAKNFLLPLIIKFFPDPSEMLEDLNPKGSLQEYTQKTLGATPRYKILEVTGPDHAPYYKVSVHVRDKQLAEGAASNRKAAETEAAKKALELLHNQTD
jgi:ribonuclease-3